ncbi:MAG: glutathione S- transferase, nitrogen catabolite repression regulator [Cirrosporium novae-zelandiae]|nr:MAG: glutathione S- transferase, nitrogen catabolite repression regulator [Cirrosporium novae-zelandiae]
MTSPITLYGHGKFILRGGPNPWKVAIILEELNIPYKTVFMDTSVLHTPVYEKVNPNGRVPAIEDPNTGITLWESGAIVEYLVEEYDKENKITFRSSPEKYHLKQYLHFQMSGQGPYFGQAAWFTFYQKLPPALERYMKEVKRVVAVLDGILKDKEWLVGDKCTYADLAFIPWNQIIPLIFTEETEVFDIKAEYPAYHAWMERMFARPAVKKILADWKAAKAAGH